MNDHWMKKLPAKAAIRRGDDVRLTSSGDLIVAEENRSIGFAISEADAGGLVDVVCYPPEPESVKIGIADLITLAAILHRAQDVSDSEREIVARVDEAIAYTIQRRAERRRSLKASWFPE